MQMSLTVERKDMDYVREVSEHLYEVGGEYSSLSLRELLILIIGKGTSSNSLNSIVDELMDIKNEYGLKGLTTQRMQQVGGIGEKKAQQILASIEFGKRIYAEKKEETTRISSPQDAYEVLKDLKHLQQEHFVVLFLDTKNQVLGRKTVFIGSLNASVVHPREVFKNAVLHSAASVIVAHNHPSGDIQPSKEDIEVTKRLKEAGLVMGIAVLDHMIIGNHFTSLKEKGYC